MTNQIKIGADKPGSHTVVGARKAMKRMSVSFLAVPTIRGRPLQVRLAAKTQMNGTTPFAETLRVNFFLFASKSFDSDGTHEIFATWRRRRWHSP